MGSQAYGIDTDTVKRFAGEIKAAHGKGLEIALVIGAGNIFRGLSAAASGIERSTADYMGMLATVMNALAMQNTAAALRAAEMECDALLKGTQVDGVYDSDPKTNPDATRYDTLTYQKVLTDDLRVMDTSAVALMRENKIPIIVFSLADQGGFDRVMAGNGVCTIIGS